MTVAVYQGWVLLLKFKWISVIQMHVLDVYMEQRVSFAYNSFIETLDGFSLVSDGFCFIQCLIHFFYFINDHPLLCAQFLVLLQPS